MTEEKVSEKQLCDEFRVWAQARHCVVYPEISGWDMVLVPQRDVDDIQTKPATGGPRTFSLAPGQQVGVHAKLLANVDVLAQGLDAGPAFRLILVRRASAEFIQVANKLGFAVASREISRTYFGKRGDWEQTPGGFRITGACQAFAGKDLTLPPVVPDLPAGVPSPRQLTPWRVKALKLCQLLKSQGWLTSIDFKSAKIDMKRWVESGWLTSTSEYATNPSGGRPLRKFVVGATDLPDHGWDAVVEQLKGLPA